MNEAAQVCNDEGIGPTNDRAAFAALRRLKSPQSAFESDEEEAGRA